MYPVTVPELEYATVTVQASEVRTSDRFLTNKNGFVQVGDRKMGHKHLTITDTEDKVIFRDAPSVQVLVERRTDESAEARGRAVTTNRLNERLREQHAEYSPNRRQLEVLVKLTEAAEAGYGPSSFTTEDLLAAQAADVVDARFNSMVEHALEKDENADLQDILRRARESFTETVVRKAAGLSRSTSVISNAMDDALTAAFARFIDRSEYDV